MSEIDTEILARRLVRAQPTAALSSVAADGQPHGSLVLVCCDLMARPVLLISALAIHTQNVRHDPRVALLFEDCRGLENPLTGPRLSLSGRLQVTQDKSLQARFLRRHPEAEMYAGFKDFDFFSLDVESAHLVAGFGRIETLDSAKYLFAADCNEELAKFEIDIITHMNTDHGEAIDLYANILSRRSETGEGMASTHGWAMTGIDAEGLDLRRAGDVRRINFDRPMSKYSQAREKLVALAERARKQA